MGKIVLATIAAWILFMGLLCAASALIEYLVPTPSL